MASSIGSSSWIGADAYEPGGEWHARAMAFLDEIKWHVLVSIASRLRGDTPCHLDAKFSIGHFNMVRRIVFSDGVSWVARLRLPPLTAESGGGDSLDVARRTLKVEVAGMRFLKANTSIPVPAVHSYSADAAPDVGAPYILMDYIDGSVASELRQARRCDFGQFGSPAQDRKFREQMAGIQVQLASLTFDKIGSLYQDEETSTFFVGPDIETGKGPWATTVNFYADLASHTLHECARKAPPEVQTSTSFALPVLFTHLMSLYGHISPTGPFSLTNRDFGAHNLLVDDDFNIVGMIDLDGLMAGPAELVAQYPTLTGLDRGPPGHVETRPAALERIRRTEPKLREYKDLLETAEAEAGIIGPGKASIASLMLSDAASILQGLLRYMGYQKNVNDKWMDAYLRLLRENARAGVSGGHET